MWQKMVVFVRTLPTLIFLHFSIKLLCSKLSTKALKLNFNLTPRVLMLTLCLWYISGKHVQPLQIQHKRGCSKLSFNESLKLFQNKNVKVKDVIHFFNGRERAKKAILVVHSTGWNQSENLIEILSCEKRSQALIFLLFRIEIVVVRKAEHALLVKVTHLVFAVVIS